MVVWEFDKVPSCDERARRSAGGLNAIFGGEMNTLKKAALCAAIAFAGATSAQAQERATSRGGFGVELTGARAQSEWGLELGVGYAAKLGPIVARPIVGMFLHEGEDNGYSRDTFSNGESRCRAPNGQFARDEECVNIAIDWYAKGELVYETATGFELGGGARFSNEKVRPYATAAFAVSPQFKIKGNAGERYFAAGLTLGF